MGKDKKLAEKAAQGQKVQPGAVNTTPGENKTVQTSYGEGTLINDDRRIESIEVSPDGTLEVRTPGSLLWKYAPMGPAEKVERRSQGQGGESSGRLPGEENVVVNENA